ncbi:calcium-binding protein [Nocardioides soli]|uniref:Ca2+-binding RTX toxin-like protein n=1 Tax=Nocardioides soli TaxID=1036020 RepID=A0A7W4VZG3_9ACTN|nr:calcium-binding protein [Nocardioides soli]MBB3044574.1 Ca2+-binding RTX toxin-like protein [Nocardioides soli]
MTLSRLQLRTVGPIAAVATLLAAAGAASVAPSSAADITTCRGQLPTMVATADGQTITGTDGDDVIIAWGFADVTVNAGAGNDRICGDPVAVDGGDGNDTIFTVGGTVNAGAGNDVVSHAGGTTDGGPGNDRIVQRQFGSARGGEGNDAVTARIHVGAVDPALAPWEAAIPAGAPVSDLAGDAGPDRLTVSAPTDGTTSKRCPACKLRVDGGDGKDTVVVRGVGARIHLQAGTARFAGTKARVRNVENVIGTAGPDVIVGDAGRNTLSGKGGRDRIYGGPGGDLLKGGAGRDLLVGQGGLDGALGGRGIDRCFAELSQNC